MKIAYTSDIHVDSSRENLHIPEEILVSLQREKPDIFVISGDISRSLYNLDQALAVFKDFSCTKIFVPGNHDIWIEKEYPNSFLKYYEHLPDVARKNNFIPIWIEPHIYGDYGFCGSMGWYDYSFKPQNLELSENDFIEKVYKDHTWMDKIYAQFIHEDTKMNDKDITSLLYNHFVQQYRELSKETNKIIALFHHMPFSTMISHRHYPVWDFFATYMGSACFGDFLLIEEKIILAIHGHYHKKQTNKIPRRNGKSPITVASSPFGYFHTECRHPVHQWYKEKLTFIEI